MFSRFSGRRHNPAEAGREAHPRYRERARRRERGGGGGEKEERREGGKKEGDELSSKFETISRHGEDMEDVEDEHGSNGSISGSTGGIWYLTLSESSTGQSGGRWEQRGKRGCGQRGEGTAPKHPCVCARSRVFLIHRGERVCVSPRLCSLARLPESRPSRLLAPAPL